LEIAPVTTGQLTQAAVPTEGEREEKEGAILLCCLKGKCHEIFCFRFFHESSSPKHPKITLGSFRIRKFVKIFAGEGAPLISTTPAENFAISTAVLLIPVTNCRL
jgi:hypothetical protein